MLLGSRSGRITTCQQILLLQIKTMAQKLLPFKYKVSEQQPRYAKIVLEPLHQGFGHTLGNSLRRVMLSYLPGAAVTAVQIDGVTHQFSTLEGMKEDIIEFVLNLKQLNIRYRGKEPVTVKLEATGPGEVTAAQIDLPTGVEISNPDLVLANLADKKHKLSATLTIESGRGYRSATEQHVTTIGLIPVDAIFSPVYKVNYQVTPTRVERHSDFDKLTLEIWTDGTIEAEEALTQAAQLLIDHYQQLINPNLAEEEVPEVDPANGNNHHNETMNLTVEELELPTRIANALRKAGYDTLGKILEAGRNKILKVKNLGGKSIDLIEEALREKGVSFES